MTREKKKRVLKIRTIFPQIIVQDFKQWKTVPSIPWLFGQHFVHVVGEQ